MCLDLGVEENAHGVRIFHGQWCEAYLGRFPVRAGYVYAIWNGRHVAEPTELSTEEAAGFWSEIAQLARAVEETYRPVKMNWLVLGNGVPHLHVHLVPRHQDDPRAGGPLESDAFEYTTSRQLSDGTLHREVQELRLRLAI
jgi:diadenosine tetraphosphate (Ap4A) HIT family hydrolase